MNHHSTVGLGSPFAMLRRFSSPRIAQERCELCSKALAPDHRHLLESGTRQVVCACDPCALSFQCVTGGRFKLIPRYPHALPGFQVTDAQWESLSLPINLAFFFCTSPGGSVKALYPSPAGATESLLPLSAWEELVVNNPELKRMEPDVETLLVNRVGTARQYYIAPIDSGYELVGLIRTHWRGLSGGEEVWRHIATFFDRLEAEAQPLAKVPQEASHA